MKILMGTKNPGKIQGANEAFEKYYKNIDFPIPEKYINEIKQTEFGKVMDKIFSGKEMGKGKGGIAILTKEEITRIDLTRNAFIMALTTLWVLYKRRL